MNLLNIGMTDIVELDETTDDENELKDENQRKSLILYKRHKVQANLKEPNLNQRQENPI